MLSLLHSCPLCGADTIAYAMTCEDRLGFGKQYALYRCNACAFLFTNPVESENEVSKYYEESDYGPLSEAVKNPVDRFAHFIRRFTVAARCTSLIKLAKKRKGSLLEIGAGTGVFASAMQRKGWDVVGIEPSVTAREQAARMHDIVLHDLNVLPQLQGRTFDMVVLWHVLEHVPDIHVMMTTVRSLLDKNGIAVIAVPNHHAFDAWYYGGRWAGYDVPLHYSHFIYDTLRRLAQAHALRIVSYRRLRLVSTYLSLLTEHAHRGSLLRGVCIGCIGELLGSISVARSSAIMYVLRHE